MDGNGRWASQRGLPRTAGHRQGIEAVRRAVKAAGEMGIEYLTIYSFSTENWSRPPSEVSFLLELMRRFIQQDVAELHGAGIRIKVIGERAGLDKSIVKLISDAENLTRGNTAMTLVVAFNYGSKQEITEAVKKIAADIGTGKISASDVNSAMIAHYLDTNSMPDPDLMIRTGGEMRISNFLLWQSAYTEFVFVPEFWPEFNAEIFRRAVSEYANRERRYGGVKVNTA